MRVRVGFCFWLIFIPLLWMIFDISIPFYYLEEESQSIRTVNTSGVRHSDDIKKSITNTEKDAQKVLDELLSSLLFEAEGSGDMGQAVILPSNLEKEKSEKYKINMFNVLVSDMISINRRLPDFRMPECLQGEVKEESILTDKTAFRAVSIIIVFYNEAFSILLRSIHSIIKRTEAWYLEEIILVDDHSDRDYLHKPLDLYIQRYLPFVRIHHFSKREGLIRARLHGAKMAKGKILVFLDSHVEVTEGWLEPLLVRILTDRKRVVAPTIDVISEETFRYMRASRNVLGGFDWDLKFQWSQIPVRENERRNGSISAPIQTPVIAGGLFAVDRSYFFEIGAYDEKMEFWGGENLEISFRVWMCGGTLEIHPCSRVGHVFRTQSPYKESNSTYLVVRNLVRTAEVWMDEYKEFFLKGISGIREINFGSVASRRMLRQKLQCKTFRWYLKNIFPEATIPYSYFSLGKVVNVEMNQCIDALDRQEGSQPAMRNCHDGGRNQLWCFTYLGNIRSDILCITIRPDGIILENCVPTDIFPNQQFDYNPKEMTIRLRSEGKCLSATSADITLEQCTGTKNQKWRLDGYKALREDDR